MYKNTILKGAISTALALPRYGLWATTAVVVAFSADAGLSVVGNHFGITAGTPVAVAVAGDFQNSNNGITDFDGTGTNLGHDVVDNATTSAIPTDAVTYASEVFASGSPTVPSPPTGSTTATDGLYQAVVYTVSGKITNKFQLSVTVSGGATISQPNLYIPQDGDTTMCIGTVAGAGGTSLTPTIQPDTDAAIGDVTKSCSIGDGAEIQLKFKLANVATTLKTPGSKIEMTMKLTGTGPAVPLNPTRTIPVAVSKAASKTEILPEMSRVGYVFVSVSDGSKLFVDKSPAGETGDSPYVSEELVKIGYVRITSQNAFNATADKLFVLGDKTGDKATFSITNGQFRASPGGVNAAGVVYIDAGSTINALSPLEDEGTTAKWTLTSSDLKNIATKSDQEDDFGEKKGAPIMIKADRLNEINDINVESGTGPSAEMAVTPDGQTAAIAVGPVELRRIPRDGVTCWVYNVPPPAGNLDLLSVRITNDTSLAGALIGTLYPQEGGDTPDFTNLNLLTKITANASDERNSLIEMVTDSSGVSQPGLKGGATIRLSAKDIADAGGVDWTEGRKVLKVTSQISELELLTLLRYGTASAEQAQSNISVGATGKACE